MMNNLNLGYAYFGKKDGFELFEIGGMLEKINRGSLREDLQTALQLKLEEIRIFEGSKVYRLSQFETVEGIINLFTAFSYALDDYQRDGFRATALALDNQEVGAQKIWDFIHLYPSHYKEANELLNRLFSFVKNQKNVRSYKKSRAFIPLYTENEAEALTLIEAWLDGNFDQFGTLYFSSNEAVARSIRAKEIRVFDENPFWEGPVKEVETSPAESGVTSGAYVRQKDGSVPGDSLVHAFESDQENRWDKKNPPQKNTKKAKTNQVWGWLALGFVGLLGGLLWIAL